MRSELIDGIFSVEAEAERIVSEARAQAREAVSKAHEEGDASVREMTEKARNSRHLRLEKAQAASAAKVASYQESLRHRTNESEQDDLVDGMAEAIVRLLCRSWCTEAEDQ